MSNFGTDLRYLLTNDASISELIGDNIFYEVLPDNMNLTTNWIVYSFNVKEQQDLLNSKNTYSVYDIVIKIVGYSTEFNNNLTNILIEVLNNTTYNGIKDIKFINDTHSTDLEKTIFMNNLYFASFYVE